MKHHLYQIGGLEKRTRNLKTKTTDEEKRMTLALFLQSILSLLFSALLCLSSEMKLYTTTEY